MKRPTSNTLAALQEIVTHGADEEYIKAACSAAIPQLRDGERWRKLCEVIDREGWTLRDPEQSIFFGSKAIIATIDAEILKGKQNG